MVHPRRMSEPRATWLVVCSCGWTREAFSEWAAHAVSKLHRQLAPDDAPHVTRVQTPEDPGSGQQLTLV